MTGGVTVTGAAELSAGLTRVAGTLQTGDPGTAAAVARVMLGSVHAPRRTGALAGTVRAELTDPAQPGITAGSPAVRYAGVHEWGSPSRGIRGAAYMRRAVAASEAAWMTVYTTAVAHQLDTL